MELPHTFQGLLHVNLLRCLHFLVTKSNSKHRIKSCIISPISELGMGFMVRNERDPRLTLSGINIRKVKFSKDGAERKVCMKNEKVSPS